MPDLHCVLGRPVDKLEGPDLLARKPQHCQGRMHLAYLTALGRDHAQDPRFDVVEAHPVSLISF
jgi:hypothetical protein